MPDVKNPTAVVREFHKSKRLWILLIASLIAFLVVLFWPSNTGDEKQNSKKDDQAKNSTSVEEKQEVTKTIEVALKAEEWTEWINLKVGDSWVLDAPGWVEYEFWNGDTKFVADKETVWFGKIKAQTASFRLRGWPGIAKLTIQRKTP